MLATRMSQKEPRSSRRLDRTFFFNAISHGHKFLSNFSPKARSVSPDLKESMSLLTNTYNQFLQDCIKDRFPPSFLHCQNPVAQELSIKTNVSASEQGRNYLQITNGMGHVSCPYSYREYATVRIGIICNYVPDDELDKNGYPTLHFKRDVAKNFHNASIRNLFCTMQTKMWHAEFHPDVGIMILLASVLVMNVCMLMGPTF